MKTSYISIQTIITDYIDQTGHEGELDPLLIYKFANDAIDRICTDEQMNQKVALLLVENYRATLPDDFRAVIQAAYRVDSPKPCTREEISEMTQKVLGTECDLKISLNCPRCKETDCSCSTPIAEVDVNRIWETAHPEVYTRHMKHFYSYGNLTERKGPCSDLHTDFRLMTTSHSSFFNAPYHIPGCANINLDCEIEYSINRPNIVVNFLKGEILLSYMGILIDEDGYRLIPNEPTVFTAIIQWIEERMAFREYRKTKTQNDRIYWQQMFELKEKMIARARGYIQTPDFDSFWKFVKQHWTKLIPYSHWEHNLNRPQRDLYRHPQETYFPNKVKSIDDL
jgi:hypothetical protein